MEILILLLVSPAIFAQRFRKHVNPNDEPFLPIHPAYPYNPKLTKRGFDKEIVTVLKPELYAPRTDARDSYTASYARNPKDSYFSGYGSSPHGSIAPYSPYSSYYGNNLYGVYMNPYTANPYGANPYPSGGPGPSSNPGFYHQPPYYYPDYYNQPFPYSFPPPDNSGPPGPPWNENSNLNRDHPPKKSEELKPSKPKVIEKSSPQSKGSGNQYVDGNNLIFQNYKDLMTQSTAYKMSSPYNQPEQIADLQFTNPPIPPTTYKVISVGGQPVGPNYPLPSTYARAQLLEQAAAMKGLSKSLGHLFLHQVADTQGYQGHPSYVTYANTVGQQRPSTQSDQDEFCSSEQNPVSKIQAVAEPHMFGSDERDLPDKESNNKFLASNQDSSSKLSNPQMYRDRQNSQNIPQTEYAIGQTDKNQETFAQSPAAMVKIPSKYQGLPYPQKSGTRVTFQQSQSAYIPPEKIPSVVLEEADSSSVQSYDQQAPLSQSIPYRSEKIYRPDQMQGVISYRNQNSNIGQGTARAYTYQQTNPLSIVQGSQQQQQQVKTNLEDVNFGSKQGNKG